MPKRWLPLEANPEVMNAFARHLGLSDDFAFHDIYGFDDELLDFVPQPCVAVLLLFPITPATEAIEGEPKPETSSSGEPWFARQTVGNACGTMGVLHAALNGAGATKPWATQANKIARAIDEIIVMRSIDEIDECSATASKSKAGPAVPSRRVHKERVARRGSRGNCRSSARGRARDALHDGVLQGRAEPLAGRGPRARRAALARPPHRRGHSVAPERH